MKLCRVTKRIKAIKPKALSINGQERMWFYIFISPWILGFLVFTLGPIIASVFLSFTNWDLFTAPQFVGIDNYKEIFQEDKMFWMSVYNTFYYALIAVPLNLILSLGMAYLLHFKLKGIKIFRTLYYLPALVPAVATTMVFVWLLAPDTGLINKFLSWFGIKGPAWLLDEKWVKMSFVFMAIWAVGSNMILLLSGMKGIADELYEAAAIDGAKRWKQFRYVTLPQLTPIIFFNLVMGIISSLQAFSQVYIMTGMVSGSPKNASIMIVPYLFDNAFKYYRMGYASAIAWILFIVITVLTVIVFKSSSMWVYYEGEVRK